MEPLLWTELRNFFDCVLQKTTSDYEDEIHLVQKVLQNAFDLLFVRQSIFGMI